MICEEAADGAAAAEIDLQCREHVASDTESEAENATDLSSAFAPSASASETTPTSTAATAAAAAAAAAEPSKFPVQQRFSSPSAIGQANSGPEVTHRPKPIKAR